MAKYEPLGPLPRDVHSLISDILRISPTDITNNRTHDAYSFFDFQVDVKTIHELLKQTLDIDIEKVPTSILKSYSAALQNFRDVARTIAAWTPLGGGSPGDRRQALYNTLNAAIIGLTQIHLPVIEIARETSQSPERQLKDYKTQLELQNADALNSIRHQTLSAEAMLAEIGLARKEAVAVVNDAKHAAVMTTVAKYSKSFYDVSTDHKKWAAAWLKTTVASLIFTAALIYDLFVWQPSETSPSQPHFFQEIIARIGVVAVGLFVAGFSSRNYKVHKHQEVVNSHRFYALNTFETFTKEASDDQTKKAILIEAAKCIFSRGSSGYLANEKDITTSISEILRIVK